MSMDNSQVIAKLRQHERELKAAGVVHLRVFGSVARGESTSASDVDLVADFDYEREFSLLDMSGLETRLSDILDAKVDLTPSRSMKPRIRERADQEAVLAF